MSSISAARIVGKGEVPSCSLERPYPPLADKCHIARLATVQNSMLVYFLAIPVICSNRGRVVVVGGGWMKGGRRRASRRAAVQKSPGQH